MDLNEFSDQSPAIASLDNQPYVAWRGRDNHLLNVMQLHDDGSAVEATKYVSGATVNGSPSLATLGNQMYVAWTGDDNHLYISTVNVGGGKIFVPPPVQLPETSNDSPALVAFNGNLFIAWTGQGNRFLNVMEVHPDLTFDEPHYVSGATVSGSPALAASNGQLFVAITGDTESLYVSTVITNGPIANGTPISVPPFTQLPETSNHGPALADDNGQLIIGWTGQGQSYLNVMQLNTTGGKITPVEPHPVRQGETASSAVALDSNSGLPVIAWTGTDGAGTLYTAPVSFLSNSPGFTLQNGVLTVNGGVDDGTITIGRINGGGLEVTLNGTTKDYAAGSLVAVVVNTGPATNTVNVLSTVKGIPVTINTGSGTNLVYVTSSSESLTDLAGPLIINGGTGGTTDVVLDDSRDPLAQTYTMTSTAFATPYSGKVSFTNLQGVTVDGGTGNDTLVVDSSAGLVAIRDGINFVGGGGLNSFQLVQTGGAIRAGDAYSVGPNAGQGSSVITDSGLTQAVYFRGLAPVLDTVPASSLTVDATPANNAISFGPGLVDPVNNGRVAIDNLEPIEFSGKTNLVIAGLGGTDTFSLNDPNTPVGLTGITVSGAGSSGLDSLIVNGVGATIGVDLAASTIAGAAGAGGAVPIAYSGMGSLTVNAGIATTLAVSNSGISPSHRGRPPTRAPYRPPRCPSASPAWARERPWPLRVPVPALAWWSMTPCPAIPSRRPPRAAPSASPAARPSPPPQSALLPRWPGRRRHL